MRHSNSLGTKWKFTNLLLEKRRKYTFHIYVGLTYSSGGQPSSKKKQRMHCTCMKVSGLVPQQTFAQSPCGIDFKHVTSDWPPLTWPSNGFSQTGNATYFNTKPAWDCLADYWRTLVTYIGYVLRWEGQHELVKTWQEVALAYFKTLLNIL